MMQILTFLVTTILQQPGTLRENILVEFFVAKDHLRDGVLFLVDANQALHDTILPTRDWKRDQLTLPHTGSPRYGRTIQRLLLE